MVVTPSPANTQQGWLSYLQEPLKAAQLTREHRRARMNPESLRAKLKELDRDVAHLRSTGRPEQEIQELLVQQGNHAFALKSRIIEQPLNPSRVAWAVRNSADGGVVIGEGQSGLSADLEDEKQVAIARLQRWFRESWDGDVLLLDGKNGQIGQINLIQSIPEEQLHREPALGLLGGFHSFPVLFCSQGDSGRQLPNRPLDEITPKLLNLVKRAFTFRQQRRLVRMKLPPTGYEILEEFRSSLNRSDTDSHQDFECSSLD
ncbi:MAG: hypothetical protein KDN20_01525 [Verrucomicrobiae bacterium]|nr:hypothetical protein [Verrucomicrobiae bacterium]